MAVKEPEIIQTTRVCSAGDLCIRKDEPIQLWSDAEGKVRMFSPTGLVFDHSGIRHHACPDLQFRAWLVEKGLTK